MPSPDNGGQQYLVDKGAIEARIGHLEEGQKSMHLALTTGFDRVIDRIDSSEDKFQTKIDEVEADVVHVRIRASRGITTAKLLSILGFIGGTMGGITYLVLKLIAL